MGAETQATPAGEVDPALLNRAITALLKHHKSTATNSNQLLDDDLDIQVQFTLARIPGKPSVKPIRLDIPHSLVKLSDDDDAADECNLQDASVCLIVKDESKPHIQELITRFPNELACIQKVLTLTSLRNKHKSYSQKRDLLSRYEIFMADDRILPMLTKALGCKFFDKKKQPIPVNICREEALPFAIQRSLRATFMFVGAGTCVTVKAGNTSMSNASLAANISSIITQAPLKLPRKWSNVKSISVKTTNSVALPVYNKTLEELEEIKGMANVGADVNADSGKKMEAVEVEKREQKKRKEMLEKKSPLARALKKQKKSKNEEDAVDTTEENTTKIPKKKDKSKEAEQSTKKKSSEKKHQTELETPAKTTEVKPKSGKKVKQSESSSSDATFIPSKKYTGTKAGYVFRKDKLGLGYYIDVKPVVDKVWLAKLKSGKVGGGRKSMGGSVKKRKGGGRRSY